MEELITLDLIDPNPYQVREQESFEHVQKIAESIAIDGLMQTPVGRRWTDGHVQLAFGHSRLAAFKLLRSKRLDGAYARMPDQVQSGGSVRPVDPFSGGTNTILEVHSHHSMSPNFSATDDREERFGFRLYAVLGELHQVHPAIRVRVGIYGHFWEIPASLVFELPGYARDALSKKQDREVVYDDLIETP